MKNIDRPVEINDQLKGIVWKAAFGGAFIMSLSSAIILAGAIDFNVSRAMAFVGFVYAILVLIAFPVIYFIYRDHSPLWVNGLMGIFGGLIPAASIFGFGEFLFYFGFVASPRWVGVFGLLSGCLVVFLWGRVTWFDVMEALHKKGMYEKAYVNSENNIYYDFGFMEEFEKVQKKRSPFKSFHLYSALVITPFVFSLNRLLTPLVGGGHGVFLVLSFLGLPMGMWICGVVVRSFVLMIFCPFTIWRATGRHVLMRGFV